jgi:hypothetical protein
MYNYKYIHALPLPLAEPSKAWACSGLIAEIVGSNPAQDMEVYPL